MKKKLLSGLLIGSALFALTSCSLDDLLKPTKSETATAITETTTGITETTTETTTTTENVVARDFVFEYAKLKGYQGEKEDFLEDLKSENITVSIKDGVSLQYKNGDVLELFKFENLIKNLVPGVNYNYGYLRLIDGTMYYYDNNTLYGLFTVSDITGYELDEIELIMIDGPWVSWRTKDSEWKQLISCEYFGGLSTDFDFGDSLYDYSKLLGYNKTPLEFLNEVDFSNYQFGVVYETYLGFQYNEFSLPLISLEDLKDFKRNISFNSGSEKETISLGLGETLTELPAPTKEGYKFLCWEYNGVEFNFAKYAYFPQDIELEAKWIDEDAIIVNYHLMDEDETVLRNVIEPEVYTKLYVPERSGYKFLGWLDEDGEAVTDGKFQDIDELHLYANWIEDTPIVISVSYNEKSSIDVFEALIKNYQEETGCYFDYRIDLIDQGNIENGLLEGDYDSDLFMASSPSLDRIYEAGFLAPVSNLEVSERNYQNVVEFATYDGTLYAYPISFDYAVLLFYDKSIIEDADVTSLEAIVEACENNQVNFAYELYNAWYSSGLFFGMGCEMTHTFKDHFILNATDDFFSENGVAALQTMYRVLNSDYFVDDSNSWDSAAKVDGTWYLETAKEAWGDNLGVAPLPSFTYNGEKHQISQLTYANYLCVNANKSKDRVALLNDLADYLTNCDAQLLCTELGKYPTNAEANEKYAEVNPYAEAIGTSLSNVVVQNEIYGQWWDVFSNMIRKVKNSEGTKEELLTILEEYYEDLQASLEGNYPYY